MFLLIITGAFALLGIGLSWVYVSCVPNYTFSSSGSPSAPSLYELSAVFDNESNSHYYDVEKVADLYQRLTSSQSLYQEVKADYEETFSDSAGLFLFALGLVLPLLVFKGANGLALIPAGAYLVTYILGCVFFRRRYSYVEEDCLPLSSRTHNFDTPAAFIKFWENVDAVQWPFVRARRDNVYELKKRAAAARTLFIIAVTICAIFGMLSFRDTAQRLADPDYCHQASYDKGYAAGKNAGYNDGYEEGQQNSGLPFDDYLLITREDYEYSCSVITQLYNILEENWDEKYFSIEEFYGYLSNFSLNVQEANGEALYYHPEPLTVPEVSAPESSGSYDAWLANHPALPSNSVFVSLTDFLYHKEACDYLSSRNFEMHIAEAKKKGLDPCPHCCG